MGRPCGRRARCGAVADECWAEQWAMVKVKRYGSFLLRYWQLNDDGQRLEIEHIQSGAKTRVASVAAAIAWISDRDRSEEDDKAPAATLASDYERSPRRDAATNTRGGRHG